MKVADPPQYSNCMSINHLCSTSLCHIYLSCGLVVGLELLDEKFEQFYAQYDDDEFESSSGDSDGDDALANEHDKHLLDQAVEDFENNFKVKCKMSVCIHTYSCCISYLCTVCSIGMGN